METPDTAGAGAPEAAETPQAPDYSAVMDRVGQLAENLGSFQQDVMSRLPEPAEPEPDDPWSGLYDEEAPEPEPQQQPQMNVQALQEALRAEVNQATQPLHDEIAQLRTTQDLNGLLEKHPDLKDPEVRQRTGQAAQEAAQMIGQQYGPEFGMALANHPEFIALVHRAQAGQAAAAAQVPAEGNPNPLEGGGGTAPGAGEPTIAERVMQQRRTIPRGFR